MKIRDELSHIHVHPFQSFEPNLTELVLVRHFARNPSSVPRFTESTPLSSPIRVGSCSHPNALRRARIPAHTGARSPSPHPRPRSPRTKGLPADAAPPRAHRRVRPSSRDARHRGGGGGEQGQQVPAARGQRRLARVPSPVSNP
jgi:hypothetical protein